MARRTFTVVDIVEIYVHWYAGRSKSQVASSLGVDRKTIRKYLAPAEAAGITPGGPPMSEADWAKLLKSWFPELASRRLNQVRWAEIEPHRDHVKSLLETTTVTTVHQRLRDEGKLKVSLSTFRRWVHENLLEEAAARRSRCCGRTSSRARRRRSTTASWASGSTPRPGNGTGSGRS
jgi:transposase